MAAAIKAINAKIRSNKVLDYVCSTRTFIPNPSATFPPRFPDRDRPAAMTCLEATKKEECWEEATMN
jgi:hypothetical protein